MPLDLYESDFFVDLGMLLCRHREKFLDVKDFWREEIIFTLMMNKILREKCMLCESGKSFVNNYKNQNGSGI